MGCGASSSKGSAPSVPNVTKPTGQPASSKAALGRKITAESQKPASLGRRFIHDSLCVSLERRSKPADLPAGKEGAASGGPSRSGSGKQPQAQPQPQRSSGSYSQKQAGSPSPPAPPAPAASPPPRASSGPAAPSTPQSQSQSRLAPLPTGSASKLQAPGDAFARPALQIPRLAAGAPLSCLAPPPPLAPQSPAGGSNLSAETQEHVQQLSSGGAGQAAAAAHVRQLLCSPRPPVQALLDKGVAAALVRCLREGSPEAKVDAAWCLTNLAASPVYGHVEALCTAQAPGALLVAMGATPGGGQRTVSKSGAVLGSMLAAAGAGGGGGGDGSRPPSAGGGGGAGASGTLGKVPEPLREQALWALANIAGALHPDYKTQALAAEVLDAGALGPVIAVIEAETSSGSGSISPSLRCAAWCLHNLAKHKREKEMVDVIPMATRLVLELSDPDVLSCLAWVLAYLGSNEDNKSHLKQALPALPRLVPWVREADSPLALPALLCVGTMCTGYMRSLDYSGQVVEAGGVPAFLAYLRKGAGLKRREMQMDALFALSNVAGANNATVQALLEAGAFGEVISLLRSAGEDEEVRMECLYVLTNAWDPLVGAELATVQQMLAAGILEELDKQLDTAAPAPRLELLLKGLTDGLKRGQMVMTYTASMLLVEKGREAAAAAPPPTNPVVDLYGKLGTVDRIKALNGHSTAEVATRANGILTLLQFMS